MIIIDTVIAPEAAPQIAPARLQSTTTRRLDSVDNELVAAVVESGPVPVWPVLNSLADRRNPRSRDERRALRIEYWYRLARLIRLGVLFRQNRTMVSTEKPVPTPRRRAVRRRSVGRGGAFGQGSTGIASQRVGPAALLHTFNQQQQEGNCPTSERPQEPAKSKCVPVHHEAGPQISDGQTIRDAAKELVALRGRKKQWTGYLGRIRLYRGQRVRLPSGQTTFVYGCRRGWLVYTDTAGKLLGGFGDPLQWGVVKVEKVILIKSGAAAVLGSAKRGRTERPSALKARAARNNGTLPCRAGKRRGRPRSKV